MWGFGSSETRTLYAKAATIYNPPNPEDDSAWPVVYAHGGAEDAPLVIGSDITAPIQLYSGTSGGPTVLIAGMYMYQYGSESSSSSYDGMSVAWPVISADGTALPYGCNQPPWSPPPPPASPPLAIPPAPPITPLSTLVSNWCTAADEVAASASSPSGTDSCAFSYDSDWAYMYAENELSNEKTMTLDNTNIGTTYSMVGNNLCDELDHETTGSKWVVNGWWPGNSAGIPFVCPSMTDVTDCCSYGRTYYPSRRRRLDSLDAARSRALQNGGAPRRRLDHHMSGDDLVLPLDAHKWQHIVWDPRVTEVVLPPVMQITTAYWSFEETGECDLSQRASVQNCSALAADACASHAVNIVSEAVSIHCELRDGACARSLTATAVCMGGMT